MSRSFGGGVVPRGVPVWVGKLLRGDWVVALRCEEDVFEEEANTCGCDSTYPKTDLRE